MIRGWYTSLSGVLAALRRLDVVADNVANVNTPGFRASRTAQFDFGVELSRADGAHLGRLGTATVPNGPFLDPGQGVLESTGLPTDLAIEGDGLFVVRAPDGGLAYTRSGAFRFDVLGRLTTVDGFLVLDTEGQPIVAPPGAFVVAADGSIEGTGQRLALVAWPAGGVRRLGAALFAVDGPTTPAAGRIRQGVLERSNVDLASAMTDLIALQRSMALSARAWSTTDATVDEAIRIGRLRG
ncbi:MAG TPA: flagellar hook-basal body protein [Candidatus Binatia bacterium]|nr:flagellar hook-basal body protein [Candidatus Binatia bacterium]